MLCAQCGRCCVDYTVDLTEEEVVSGVYRVEEDVNDFAPGVLNRVMDGSGSWRCCYLNDVNRCTIYNRRPEACRIFACEPLAVANE